MQPHHHAVVIGASFAGLLAARALSQHIGQVTIVERDVLPDDATFRSGTPQARHLHVLLERGQRAMEALIPELAADLEAYGAPKLHWGVNNRLIVGGREAPRKPTDIHTHMITRVGLEYLVRQRVRQVPNIHFRLGARVTGLIAGDDGFVGGITLEGRRSRQPEAMHADVVVDASGRSSPLPDWLEALGYRRPKETLIDAFVGYSTVWFERPADAPADWVTLTIAGVPQNGFRGGIIYQMENNVWNVILTGVNGDHPPTDYDAFIEWSRTLARPDIYEHIRRAKPISPVYGYRRTNNIWRHYERMVLPHNLLVTGDAAVSFNPIYGQGMSAAALDAEVLANLLRDWQGAGWHGFSAVFQKQVAEAVQGPWQLAVSADFRHPRTMGQRPPDTRLTRLLKRYGTLAELEIGYDGAAAALFYEIMHLRKPITAYFAPWLIWRVLRHHRAVPPARYNPPVEPLEGTSSAPAKA
jgi:2-polyprenyl-6-methoxyphenol hydroxylase-like FAD-dependent oxidoreductase